MSILKALNAEQLYKYLGVDYRFTSSPLETALVIEDNANSIPLLRVDVIESNSIHPNLLVPYRVEGTLLKKLVWVANSSQIRDRYLDAYFASEGSLSLTEYVIELGRFKNDLYQI